MKRVIVAFAAFAALGGCFKMDKTPPKDMQAYVKLYPGSTQMMSMNLGGMEADVVTTTATPDDVIGFYRTQGASDGLSETSAPTATGSRPQRQAAGPGRPGDGPDADRGGQAAVERRDHRQPDLEGPAKGRVMSTAYDFSAQTLDGQPAPLADHRGEVMLIRAEHRRSKVRLHPAVTPDLRGALSQVQGPLRLVRSWTLPPATLSALAQERPGTRTKIATIFCSLTLRLSAFRMMGKIDVNGLERTTLQPALRRGRLKGQNTAEGSSAAPKGSSGTSPSSRLIDRKGGGGAGRFAP